MSTAEHNVDSVDPLAALRSADSRPAHERWREVLRGRVSTIGDRFPVLVISGLVALALTLVGWRMQQGGEPPVEESLPYAASADAVVVTPASPDVTEGVTTAVVVHVAGSVLKPGLVVGADGWRVADAIAAAGGSRPTADLNRVNLAARVLDGERIYVPEVGEETLPNVVGPERSTGAGEASGPVNLNTADMAALDSLPGVGPATAATIVAHRDENGPFGSVEALVAVRGIGPAKLDSLREHVTVG